MAEGPFTDLRTIIAYAFDHPKEGVGLPSYPFAPVTTFFCEVRLGIDVDDVSPIATISQVSPRPILLINDRDEDLLPLGSVERLYEAARNPKALWQVTAPHGKGWESAPEEYERRVLAFWRQAFGMEQTGPMT